jgi:hypothetical protein
MSHVTNGQPMERRFWVVGGKYESIAFDHLIEGTECAFGPFASEDDAKRTWRSVAERTRSEATVRFTIAAEPSAARQVDSTGS